MTSKIELLLGAALAALTAVPAHAAEGPRTDTMPPRAAPQDFAPPQSPLVLTRELRKDFARGGELVARRRYAIRFVPEGNGWRVEGALVTSEVEAPETVSPQLLEIERTRSDEGLFPMRLDRRGLIVNQPGAADSANEAAMLAAARRFLADRGLPEGDRAAALALAERLQAQSRAAGGNWPVDLFRPRPGEHSEVRTLPALDGASGRVTITIAADDRPDGLLERLERRVVTEAAGSSRRSVETWTLSRAR